MNIQKSIKPSFSIGIPGTGLSVPDTRICGKRAGKTITLSAGVCEKSRMLAALAGVPYIVRSRAENGFYSWAGQCGVPAISIERGGSGYLENRLDEGGADQQRFHTDVSGDGKEEHSGLSGPVRTDRLKAPAAF